VTWFERRYYFDTLPHPLSIPESVNRLSSAFFFAWRLLFRPPRSLGLGSAGKRTEAQQQAARDYGQRLLASIPATALIAFTDGSAKPNPGPCGAGALLRDDSGSWIDEAVAALGPGSNNVGELWAIGMALELAAARVSRAPGLYPSLYILTDSQYSIGVLTLGWKVKGDDTLVKAVKAKIASLATCIDIHIEWVPAHVGISDNEHADHLACAGAQRSALKRINIHFDLALKEGRFLPP